MTAEALSAMQPNRLSASRSLINILIDQGWRIERLVFDVDEHGAGDAVYRVHAGGRTLDFVAFAFTPSAQERTQRIFDQSWDMMGALIDGAADAGTIEWTRRELPLLYHGRATPDTLTWCRSNRSMRIFEHVVTELAAGRQPDVAALARVGYLMRNVGLDGNGTFGTRTFLAYGEDHPLRVPYHAQMLSAYLMREFSFDLAERLAALRSPHAVPLGRRIKRFLGVGNSSALGLVLWVGNHPQLVGRWIELRERALAHAWSLVLEPGGERVRLLIRLLDRAVTFLAEDTNEYTSFVPAVVIADELATLRHKVVLCLGETTTPPTVAEAVGDPASDLSAEAREVLHAILLELDPGYADGSIARLVVNESTRREPAMPIGRLRELLATEYAWALEMDVDSAGRRRNVWYKSRSAEEPRCGPAEEVPPGTVDLTVDVPGTVRALDGALAAADPALPVGRFLAAAPQHRGTVERVQTLSRLRYHTPHVDLRHAGFVPAHLIRLGNAALYGLDRTKDFMLRDLRGVIFQGAPTREDLAAPPEDEIWFWPPIPPAGEPARAKEAR
ncbi:hypothetical protein Aple_036190 [Acrocarpospora pleiomorpha]|uniref:Uncharacterized protein n=1 Tax=Acrocarpospora pleiomorpha TaxID=90975 RepID=A0A5M3XNK8_9ACTN|nr:hypothetical protein [Acrocarpospora pleiomorpha]GES20723.1 hypothetical protein Aple_036190 [Acrocarpospora pleiomorpha]